MFDFPSIFAIIILSIAYFLNYIPSIMPPIISNYHFTIIGVYTAIASIMYMASTLRSRNKKLTDKLEALEKLKNNEKDKTFIKKDILDDEIGVIRGYIENYKTIYDSIIYWLACSIFIGIFSIFFRIVFIFDPIKSSSFFVNTVCFSVLGIYIIETIIITYGISNTYNLLSYDKNIELLNHKTRMNNVKKRLVYEMKRVGIKKKLYDIHKTIIKIKKRIISKTDMKNIRNNIKTYKEKIKILKKYIKKKIAIRKTIEKIKNVSIFCYYKCKTIINDFLKLDSYKLFNKL